MRRSQRWAIVFVLGWGICAGRPFRIPESIFGSAFQSTRNRISTPATSIRLNPLRLPALRKSVSSASLAAQRRLEDLAKKSAFLSIRTRPTVLGFDA
jgi:hypothetical protein